MSIAPLPGKENGDIGINWLSAWPGEDKAPLDFDFKTSVAANDSRRIFVENFLNEIEGSSRYEVMGTLWDLNKATEGRFEKHPLGHYSIHDKQTGEKFVLCVGVANGEQALDLGEKFYQALNQKGVETVGALRWNDNKFMKTLEHEGKQLFIHKEEYKPGAKWVMSKGIEGKGFELGELVGKIMTVTQNMPEEIAQQVIDYSSQTTILAWQRGEEILRRAVNNDTDDLNEKEMHILAALQSVLKETGADAKEISRLATKTMNNDDLFLSHFNVIEKSVWVVDDNKDDNKLVLGSQQECFAIGAVADKGYDLGTAVFRQLLNPNHYPRAAEQGGNIQDAIFRELNDFTQGVNKTTGLNMTVPDILEQAKVSFSMFTANVLGIHSERYSKMPDAEPELLNHIKNTLKNNAKTFAGIQNLKIAYPAWSAQNKPGVNSKYVPR